MKTIVETGNDAIVQVKGNQKFLLKACQDVTQEEPPADAHVSSGNGHGRKEKRTVRVFRNLSSFSQSIKNQWGAYVKAVVKVTRTVTSLNTKTKVFEKRSEEAYYVSTKAAVRAQEASRFIREHWGIENRNHYVRDVAMQEDHSRIRRNPDRMVRLRSFALNTLRANGKEHIKLTRFENSLSIETVLKYKGIC